MDYYSDTNATDGPMGISTANPPFEFSDFTQRVLVAILILIISIVGTIGNSLVIIAVLLSKKLRTATNAFVVNLSTADLLTSLVIPFHSVALLSQDGMPFGGRDWVCSVVIVVVFSTVGCSICTLASIGLNRLLLITTPLATYQMFYTPKKIAVWLVSTWMIPLLVVILPLLLDVGAVGYNKQYHACGPDLSHPRAPMYSLITITTLYPVPLITIITSYILIWWHLHRHTMRISSSGESESISTNDRNIASTSITLSSMNSTVPVSLPRLSRRQYEITKNMFCIVCTFIVCLTPYAICSLFDESGPVILYAAVFLLMNSCINPLVYATKHRDFKTAFGCIFRRQWDLIPEPSDTLKALRRPICCWASDLSS